MKAKTFTLTIPGTPQAIKAGAPCCARDGRVYIRSNEDSNKEKYRIAELALTVAEAEDFYPFGGAIVMHVDYYFQKPKHKIRKNSTPFPFPNCTPDFDNLIKVTMDGIQRANGPKRAEVDTIVWSDDGQVLGGHCIKHWCVGDENPRTEVTLVEVTDPEVMCLYMSMIDEAKEVLIGGVA